MGEIGIDRNVFMYDLQFWEIILIVNGYNSRLHPGWEQARLIAHQVHYCMGVPKGESPKTPSEWLPFGWEGDEPDAIPDEAEVQRQRKKLQEYNRQHQQKENP